jgi:general stress protein 26
MDPDLKNAIEQLHDLASWVNLATIGKDGDPHVTPMMMGMHDESLLFSLTGKQKQRNMERDPRVCVSISKPQSMAHVIVWGNMEIRRDEEAQVIWEKMITDAFGPSGLDQRSRELSEDGTSLGILTPVRHRVYGLD